MTVIFKHVSIYKMKIRLLFFCYLVCLICLVWVVGKPFENNLPYNLVPFKTIALYWHAIGHGYVEVAMMNVVGNILLTVPFGFFIFLLLKKARWWKALLAGFLLSSLIETGQFILYVAEVSSRSIDVDDILLNVIGTGAGYLLAKLFWKKLL